MSVRREVEVSKEHTVRCVLSVALLGRCGLGGSLGSGIWIGGGGGSDRSRKGEKGICILHGEELKPVWLGTLIVRLLLMLKPLELWRDILNREAGRGSYTDSMVVYGGDHHLSLAIFIRSQTVRPIIQTTLWDLSRAH